MANFSLLFTSVLLAVLAAPALAAPWPVSSKHETHRVRHYGRDLAVRVETYHPKSSFEVRCPDLHLFLRILQDDLDFRC